MTHKENRVYIRYMLDCIDRIDEYTEGKKQKFFESTLIQDAVVRNLQTLAESSQRLSTELKEKHPSIPWRDISGFRNILAHDYLGFDLDVVWSVVEMDLPSLRAELERM